jgi:hypothetical protein
MRGHCALHQYNRVMAQAPAAFTAGHTAIGEPNGCYGQPAEPLPTARR